MSGHELTDSTTEDVQLTIALEADSMATEQRSGSETETEETTTEETSTEETQEQTSTESTQEQDSTDSETETEAKESQEETEEEDSDEEESQEETTLTAEAARKLRSENRSLRARLKEAEAQVKNLQPLAEELTTLKRTTMLNNIQAEFGLNDEQAGFLQGETEEELKTSAEKIVAAFGISSSRARVTVAKPLTGSTPPGSTQGAYTGSKFSIKRAQQQSA